MPIILIVHFGHMIDLWLEHGWNCVRLAHSTPFGRWACTPARPWWTGR